MKRTKFPPLKFNLPEVTNYSPHRNFVTYSTDEEPIILSKSLLDILLKDIRPAEVISLYCFYYYTAKWQKTNKPKATTGYVAKGLKWYIDKVRIVKTRLKILGLIEDIQTRNNKNQIIGHYIKVNFVWRQNIPTPTVSHSMDFSGTNALNKNNKKERKIIPPSLKMIKNYCKKINSIVDPEIFYNFYASKGWMVGSNKMKDWHCAIATWEKGHKQNNNNNKPPFVLQDNIRYNRCSDGYYRHPESGDIYIP